MISPTAYAARIQRKFQGLTPSKQRLLAIALGIGVATICYAAWSLLYAPLSPVERSALNHAKQLHGISRSLDSISTNIYTFETKPKVIDTFLDATDDVQHRCDRTNHYTLPAATTEHPTPDSLRTLKAGTTKLCADLAPLANYSLRIIQAIKEYATTPADPSWTLPAADPKPAKARIHTLTSAVESARLNIVDVQQADNGSLNYPGLDEMRQVLIQDQKALTALADALQADDLQTANQLWRPALTLVAKNQMDLLNQRSYYWREYVGIAELQGAVKKQRSGYCAFVPPRAKKPTCQ